MNAVELLKKDQDDVDALFKDDQMLAEGDGDSGRYGVRSVCGPAWEVWLAPVIFE